MAELAKILADDPQMLRRFMAVQQLDGTNLRDQMTLLAERQKVLTENVAKWNGANEKERPELSMQKTTDDLVVQLRGLPMDRLQFEKLAQSLRLSDFVKFARYVPSAEDDRNTFETIKNAIVAIEK